MIVGSDSYGWYNIVYGNGYYICSGDNGLITKSTDGSNWSNTITIPEAKDVILHSSCYGNGKYVILGWYSNFGVPWTLIYYSTDSINWTRVRLEQYNRDMNKISFVNDIFVLTGDEIVATSADGINFTNRINVSNVEFNSTSFGNGIYMAMNIYGSKVGTSTNGIDWTLNTTTGDKGGIGICYGNGMFLGYRVTSGTVYFVSSTDGINWTIRSNSPNNWSIVGLVYANDSYIAVQKNNSYKYRLISSTDGINWSDPVPLVHEDGTEMKSNTIIEGICPIK